MAFKGHFSKSTTIVRLLGLFIRDRKVGCTYFQTNVAEMTLNVDQRHGQWVAQSFNRPHITFC